VEPETEQAPKVTLVTKTLISDAEKDRVNAPLQHIVVEQLLLVLHQIHIISYRITYIIIITYHVIQCYVIFTISLIIVEPETKKTEQQAPKVTLVTKTLTSDAEKDRANAP